MTFIHDRVLERARQQPSAPALVDEHGSHLNYGQLEHSSRVLAAAITSAGPALRRVAVMSRKSSETLVAFLACLRAGVAYVPIDPTMPLERRCFVLADSGCSLLLDSERDTQHGVEQPLLRVAIESLLVDRTGPAYQEQPTAPGDEAYVLYTSGSTGKPKGVVISHRNAAAFVDWATQAFPLTPADQVAVHAPLHFDLPVYDVWVGLGAGAAIHPVPERTAMFPQALADFLGNRRISCLYAVPTALTALVRRSSLAERGLPDLRQVLFAGEEFRSAPLAELMRALPAAHMANLYGPIETNVVTAHLVTEPPAPEERIPVGLPVDGAVVDLLDDNGVILDGIAEGELVVAGECITPGYLNRPDLTDAATVTRQGRRYYRTGDIARRDGDGLLHLLGRRDGLIKTRGYRVELGEIEAVLAAHPQVDTVAVIAVPDPELTHRLHAAVVAHIGTATAGDGFTRALTDHCRSHLPGYMVPSTIHVLDELPTTGTGKTSRRALMSSLDLVQGAESR